MQDSAEPQPTNHREEKRRRILRAAIDEFARKGYFSARMSDVAKAASVADGTLYLYFEGKEHLLVSVFDDVLSRAIDRARVEIAGVSSPLERLRIVIRLHLETLAGDRALAQVMQIETRHSQRFMNLLSGRLGEFRAAAVTDRGPAARRDPPLAPVSPPTLFRRRRIVNSWLLAGAR
jgi:AcrR family transcriptional regulator